MGSLAGGGRACSGGTVADSRAWGLGARLRPVACVEAPVLGSRGFERGGRGALLDLEGFQPRSALSNVTFQGID